MDKRVAKSKTSIQNALLQLLQQKNFPDITVSEIARAADIDRKTFYSHYHTTTDVLDELEAQLSLQATAIFQQMQHFDADLFVDGLTNLMFLQFDIYVHISRNDDYSFILDDGKAMLTELLISQLQRNPEIPEKEFSAAMKFIAAGVIDQYRLWLSSANHAESDLVCLSTTAKQILGRELAVYALI